MTLSLNEAVSFLTPTYKSIELKGIAFKRQNRLINLALVTSFSDQIPYENVEKKENSKLIFFRKSYPLTYLNQIKESFQNEKITIDQNVEVFLKKTNLDSLNLTMKYAHRDGSNIWPVLEVEQSSKGFIESINWHEAERGAKEFGYPHFPSMRNYLLGFYIDSTQESIIRISLPIYAKLNHHSISREKIPSVEVIGHKELGKLNILKEILDYNYSPPKPTDPEHKSFFLLQNGINNELLDFNKIQLQNEKVYFKISLTHPQLGEEIDYLFVNVKDWFVESNLIGNPLLEVVSLFIPLEDINIERMSSKRVNGKDKPQNLFEENVSDFLSVSGFSSIRLEDYEYLIAKESKNRIGSADIIAYDRITGTILVISCKSGSTDKNTIDQVYNTTKQIEMLLKESSVSLVPVVFTKTYADTIKEDALKIGVIVIDIDSMQRLRETSQIRLLDLNDLRGISVK